MKIGGFIRENKKCVYFLIVALFVRLFLAQFGTLDLDFNSFIAWGNRMYEVGPGRFYDEWSDYSPGYLYVLWLLSALKAKFIFLDQKFMIHLLYKLPAIIADIATGLMIFLAVSKFNKKYALVATAFYIFNPAIFANSAMWGQVDSVTSVFAFASVFFASSNPIISAVTLALGTLIKPQAGFIAPLIGMLWIKTVGWRKATKLTVLTALVFLGGFVPFSIGKPFFPFVLERLGTTAGQYPYTSVNAFNAWVVILGSWKSDAGWPHIMGILITLLISIAALWLLWNKEKKDSTDVFPYRFLVSAAILAASFLFLTRMHERHLLTALAPLTVSAAAFPLLWAPYFVFSLMYIANLRFAYVWITKNFEMIFPDRIIVLFSVVNVTAFFIMLWTLFNPQKNLSPAIARFFSSIKEKFSKLELHESDFVKKHWRVLLAIIIVFAFITRIYGLNSPSEFYFDEIYHAYSAIEVYKGNPDAWVWFGKAAEGRAFSWDHPPLPKLGMAAGIALFGESAIGWRVPNALLGVGTVLFVYLIGFYLFKNQTVSILGAAIFALDGLPLVLSRIGMNDIYFLFFALGTIYFLLKDRYMLSAVFLGLSGASKWSTMWLIPVIILIMFVLKRRPGWRLAWFVVLPAAVYMLSYVPFFTTGHTVDQFIELQQQMWWYHTRLDATHPFTSPWWAWPLMLKPVWLYSFSENGIVATIYAHGNPAVFWIGIVAVFATLLAAIASKKRELWVLVVAYAGLFIPWSISPRIMFLYHYLPSVPFLCLMLAWVLMSNRKWKLASISFLVIAFLLFLFIYPRLIGIPMTESLNVALYSWLPH